MVLRVKIILQFPVMQRINLKVRIIGGEETDTYITDRTASGKKVQIYDVQDSIYVNEKDYRVNRNEDTLYEYKRDRTKYDWFMPFIIPGYNPDDGVHFGLGFKYKKQKWGKAPFGWEQSLRLNMQLNQAFLALVIRDYSTCFW
jgi:hypothetical protein